MLRLYYARSSPGVSSGIGNSRFGKALPPKLARVTASAGESFWRRIIATGGEGIIHAKLRTCGDDLRLGHLDQGCMNRNSLTFNAGLSRYARQFLESGDEFRTTIGIAAVIERIYANEDIG